MKHRHWLVASTWPRSTGAWTQSGLEMFGSEDTGGGLRALRQKAVAVVPMALDSGDDARSLAPGVMHSLRAEVCDEG